MNEERVKWITLGEKLKHMREWDNRFQRRLATEEVVAMLREQVPARMMFSRSKLRNIEQGNNEPDVRDVQLLVTFYGHKLEDVAPWMVEEMVAWRDAIDKVAAGYPCFTAAA